jgi:hypothetical protein
VSNRGGLVGEVRGGCHTLVSVPVTSNLTSDAREVYLLLYSWWKYPVNLHCVRSSVSMNNTGLLRVLNCVTEPNVMHNYHFSSAAGEDSTCTPYRLLPSYHESIVDDFSHIGSADPPVRPPTMDFLGPFSTT